RVARVRAGGLARLGGQSRLFGQRLRGVEVLVERGFDRAGDQRPGVDVGQLAQGGVEPVERADRLLDQAVRPVQRLPVVRRKQRVAQRLGRVFGQQVADLGDVA